MEKPRSEPAVAATESIITIADFFSKVRTASLDQLRVYGKAPDLQIFEVELEKLPFVQHMTHILVSGSDLDLTFKSHFMLDDALRLLKLKIGTAATSSQAVDFMKEFSNIVAGKTKTMLETAGFVVAQSLPCSVRGYNEIFYTSNDGRESMSAWSLIGSGVEIHCSAAVSVRNDGTINRLKSVEYEEEVTGKLGDVEIF